MPQSLPLHRYSGFFTPRKYRYEYLGTIPDSLIGASPVDSMEHVSSSNRRSDALFRQFLACRRAADLIQRQLCGRENSIARHTDLYEDFDTRVSLCRARLQETIIEQLWNCHDLIIGRMTRDEFDAQYLVLLRNKVFWTIVELELHSIKPQWDAFVKVTPRLAFEQQKELFAPLIKTFGDYNTFSVNICRKPEADLAWSKLLRSRYTGSYRPDRSGLSDEPESLPSEGPLDLRRDWGCIWSPILGAFEDSDSVRPMHFVPRSPQNEPYIQYLFRVSDASHILQSPTNGIFMNSCLAEAFARGEFILLPTALPALRVRVLVRGWVRTPHQACWHYSTRVYWHGLDGKLLRFPPGSILRPSYACLFHFAFTTLLYAKQQQWEGIDAEIARFANNADGSYFPPDETYLDRGMLDRLWTEIAGEPMPRAFEKWTFDSAAPEVERLPEHKMELFHKQHRNALETRRVRALEEQRLKKEGTWEDDDENWKECFNCGLIYDDNHWV